MPNGQVGAGPGGPGREGGAMSGPSYDFFATGRPEDAGETPVTALPGADAEPVGAPTAEDATGAPAAPGPVAFPVAPGSGYAPGSVNQFGTPLDVVPVPTGPFAAPGIGAAPIESPGMLSTWAGPAEDGDAATPVTGTRHREKVKPWWRWSTSG